MKFLLDVCVSSRSLSDFLATRRHDVVSAYSIDPRADDERLLTIALSEDRILVTEDKDYGEIVFVQNRPHGPIVRLVELSVAEQVRAIDELVSNHARDLVGPTIVTVTPGRVRIRRRDR